MDKRITDGEYRALAELRYRIRRFVNQGDLAARKAGLKPQQYLLLLAIRGLPEGRECTIQTLAERLSLQHHSTVELVDRMEQHGYVRRMRSSTDRRKVQVRLQARGETLLGRVVSQRIIELRSHGHALVEVISSLLEESGRKTSGKTRPATRVLIRKK